MARLIISLVKLYQRTISPDHSSLGKGNSLRCCKFYPSCSEYAVQTLRKQGFVSGIPKIIWRIFRCHPWSKGGVDTP
ncbi:membrane protein insertion efficiency factor YidD [Candidatus Gracilibacteria bacterium]|nr:membrane protein insertion efficiency factor YidD [Candidatus Gracilibacteria bacterium]